MMDAHDTNLPLNQGELEEENDLSNVANIVLLHLSSNNSDEHLFVSEVQKITGKAVYAAKPGLSITLNNF